MITRRNVPTLVFVFFLVYVLLLLIFLIPIGRNQSRSSHPASPRTLLQDFKLSKDTMSGLQLLLCITSRAKTSFLDHFEIQDHPVVKLMLESLQKKTSYSNLITDASNQRIMAALMGSEFDEAYNQFLSVLYRNHSQISSAKHPASSFLFSESFSDTDLHAVEKKLDLLPLMAQGSSLDEEDLIINLFHPDLSPSWFQTDRVCFVQQGQICHSLDVNFRKLSEETFQTAILARSLGSIVLDFDVEDGQLDPTMSLGFVPNTLGNFSHIDITPGLALTASLWANRVFKDFSEHPEPFDEYELNVSLTNYRNIKVSDLNHLEICRLKRQLSKRCNSTPTRRRIIGQLYPNLCQELERFYPTLEFDRCPLEPLPQTLSADLTNYIKHNLSKMIILLNPS